MTELERRLIRRRIGADPYYMGQSTQNPSEPTEPDFENMTEEEFNEYARRNSHGYTMEELRRRNAMKHGKSLPLYEAERIAREQSEQANTRRREEELKRRREVLEDAFTEEDVDDFLPRDYNGQVPYTPRTDRVLTPGDYTRNIGNYAGKIDPVSRAVLTPGDYTRNIGNSRHTEGFTDYAKRQYEHISKATKSNGTRNIREDGTVTKRRGQPPRNEVQEKKTAQPATKSVRDGTMARIGTRQVLEDGFKEEKKNKSNFRGIKP